MVKRSFSNPLLRVFRRRSKNDDDKDASRHRKESLDQTVLSGDDSRFNRSMTSHASSTSTFAPASPAMRRVSQSDPSIQSSGLPSEAFMSYECISSQDLLMQNSRPEFVENHAGSPSVPYQTQQQRFLPPPTNTNSQEFVQPPSNSFERDPTLQARIEAVEIQQRLLGEHHPDVIFALSSLVKLCQRKGDFEGALSIMRECQMRSMQAKTLAHEQQVSRIQQQEMRGMEGVLPSEISFENSYDGL